MPLFLLPSFNCKAQKITNNVVQDFLYDNVSDTSHGPERCAGNCSGPYHCSLRVMGT